MQLCANVIQPCPSRLDEIKTPTTPMGREPPPWGVWGLRGKVRAHSHPSSHLNPKEVASAKHGRATARTAHVSQTTINKPSSTQKSSLVFGLLNRICPSIECCGSVGFFRKRPTTGNPFPFFPPFECAPFFVLSLKCEFGRCRSVNVVVERVKWSEGFATFAAGLAHKQPWIIMKKTIKSSENPHQWVRDSPVCIEMLFCNLIQIAFACRWWSERRQFLEAVTHRKHV